jgi:hypothetical protein
METDLWEGLDKENNARGWLLLEHLRVWHAWNVDEQNPFHSKVDTERIALVGHSRGGEAVALAAAFNRLPYNPDNAAARFDYGYHIRSIVAIAPVDRQYRPTGSSTRLEDINYFTIQGSHDSDVSSFDGLNQFDRVRFTGKADVFKSTVYVYGANHGQFNTSWGEFDVGVGFGTKLQPQIETVFLKSALLHRDALSEPIFQTFPFPLADFHGANQEFDAATTVKMRLIFDRTPSGVVIFDKAAFGARK